MPKPIVFTAENIRKDCVAAKKSFLPDVVEYRLVHMLCWALLIVLSVMARHTIATWCLIIVEIYHFVRLIIRIVDVGQFCKRMADGDFTVTTDVLKYINTETIYEPYIAGRHGHFTREITKLYFTSLSHRLAYAEYYSWSEEMPLTPQGLVNTSNEGDEFYLVLDNKTHDVLCVYNKRFFTYKECR